MPFLPSPPKRFYQYWIISLFRPLPELILRRGDNVPFFQTEGGRKPRVAVTLSTPHNLILWLCNIPIWLCETSLRWETGRRGTEWGRLSKRAGCESLALMTLIWAVVPFRIKYINRYSERLWEWRTPSWPVLSNFKQLKTIVKSHCVSPSWPICNRTR